MRGDFRDVVGAGDLGQNLEAGGGPGLGEMLQALRPEAAEGRRAIGRAAWRPR